MTTDEFLLEWNEFRRDYYRLSVGAVNVSATAVAVLFLAKKLIELGDEDPLDDADLDIEIENELT